MKIALLFLVFFSFSFPAQEKLPFDTLKLREVQDFFADDYGNIYLYKNKNFSFTKYDSIGNQLGQLMMTVPFRVQGVNNPLSIFLFSENAQELRMLDQNLNEIQRIDFTQKFGFVKAAYTEDLQQIWILDSSSKRLIQYNYRQDTLVNSYPLNFNFDPLIAILVYDNLLYALYEQEFSIYNFRGKKLASYPVIQPRKLYRENNTIYVITKNEIKKISLHNTLETVFSKIKSQFVDKNSTSYFELKAGKLYIYKIEK